MASLPKKIVPPPSKVAVDLPAPSLPARIRMTSPYGYYTDDGDFRNWGEGHVVIDAHEIADLVSRKAPHIEV